MKGTGKFVNTVFRRIVRSTGFYRTG